MSTLASIHRILVVDDNLSIHEDIRKILSSPEIELDPVPFDLRKLLEDVAEMMAPKGHAKGLEVCCDLPGDVPTWVNGDADRLRQVVLNLVSNAVKLTERGQVVIRVRQCKSECGTKLFRFEVSDTGIGIPDESRNRLFKLFSQVDASTTRRYGGTGLGLALCKRLVELFGGEIGVDSTLGKGSTFWFTARLDSVAQHVEPDVVPGKLQDLRVLVVDDSTTNLEIASGHLQRWGIPCSVTDHAPKALEELKNAHRAGRPYGLAILDMQMPDMDGRELVERIRSTPEIANIPLIMLTSIGKEMSGEQSITGMLSEYLAKPIRQSRLFDAVMNATSREPVKMPELPISATKSALSHFEGKGYQVLVAEDNEVNQVVIRELITRLGIACNLVGNGQMAMELAASCTFDLVLMDSQMPVMDGLAATQAIRAGEGKSRGWSRRGGRLPVVALTANAIAGDREHCLAAGMDDYLTKPIDRKALVALLEKWLAEPVAVTGGATLNNRVSESLLDKAVAVSSGLVSSGNVFPACFDPVDLLERCFHDCEMAVELLNMFEHCAQSNLGAIDQALARRDRVELVRIAHTLKGVAGNLAATKLLELTAKIDREYRQTDSDCDSLQQDVSALRYEVARCLAAVPELRVDIQGHSSTHGVQ